MTHLPLPVLLLAAGALAPACRHQVPLADKVLAPPVPTPLAGVNSKWDDFNASKPTNWRGLIFSTNRGSGRDLDVWYTEVAWNQHPQATWEPSPFGAALMSSADERGPLLLEATAWGNQHDIEQVLVLASNREGGKGGLDLYWSSPCSVHGCTQPLQPLDALNSASNDAYLSLPFADRRALFASDRSGSGYDIYEAVWRPGSAMSAAPASIRLVHELSSDADDTAPYVAALDERRQPEVVFASRRAGGLGQHDIWCSRFEGGKWQTPSNLGAAINSPHDEFRPSLFVVEGATFLVFSSDRPGGLGGYDLYTVRYPGCPTTR